MASVPPRVPRYRKPSIHQYGRTVTMPDGLYIPPGWDTFPQGYDWEDGEAAEAWNVICTPCWAYWGDSPCEPLGFHIIWTGAPGSGFTYSRERYCVVCRRWLGGVPVDRAQALPMLLADEDIMSPGEALEDPDHSSFRACEGLTRAEPSILHQGREIPRGWSNAEHEAWRSRNTSHELGGTGDVEQGGTSGGDSGQVPEPVPSPIPHNPGDMEGLPAPLYRQPMDERSVDPRALGLWEVIPSSQDIPPLLREDGQ